MVPWVLWLVLWVPWVLHWVLHWVLWLILWVLWVLWPYDEDVDVGDVERDRFAFDNVPSSMMLPTEMMDTGAGAKKTPSKKGGAEKNPPAAAVARTAKAGTTNAQAPAAKAKAKTPVKKAVVPPSPSTSERPQRTRKAAP